jgi:hypothetical protein
MNQPAAARTTATPRRTKAIARGVDFALHVATSGSGVEVGAERELEDLVAVDRGLRARHEAHVLQPRDEIEPTHHPATDGCEYV